MTIKYKSQCKLESEKNKQDNQFLLIVMHKFGLPAAASGTPSAAATTTAMKGKFSFSVDSLLSKKTIENLREEIKDSRFTELELRQDSCSDSNQENIEEWGFYNHF